MHVRLWLQRRGGRWRERRPPRKEPDDPAQRIAPAALARADRSHQIRPSPRRLNRNTTGSLRQAPWDPLRFLPPVYLRRNIQRLRGQGSAPRTFHHRCATWLRRSVSICARFHLTRLGRAACLINWAVQSERARRDTPVRSSARQLRTGRTPGLHLRRRNRARSSASPRRQSCPYLARVAASIDVRISNTPAPESKRAAARSLSWGPGRYGSRRASRGPKPRPLSAYRSV